MPKRKQSSLSKNSATQIVKITKISPTGKNLRSTSRCTKKLSADETRNQRIQSTSSNNSVIYVSSDSEDNEDNSEDIDMKLFTYPEKNRDYVNLNESENVSNTTKQKDNVTSTSTIPFNNDLQFELDRIQTTSTSDFLVDSLIPESSQIEPLSNLIDNDDTLELFNINIYTNPTHNVTEIGTPDNQKKTSATVDLVAPIKSQQIKSTCASMNMKDSPNGRSLECPICLESLSNKQIYSAICGHIYCKECIFKIVNSTRKCAQCRVALTKNKIHPIFL